MNGSDGKPAHATAETCINCGFTYSAHADGYCPTCTYGTRFESRPSRAEPEKEVMPSVPEEQAPTRDSLQLSGVPVETPRRVVGDGESPQEPTRGEQIAAKFGSALWTDCAALAREIDAALAAAWKDVAVRVADLRAEVESLRIALSGAQNRAAAAEARVRELNGGR